jgi:hypothetical protein
MTHPTQFYQASFKTLSLFFDGYTHFQVPTSIWPPRFSLFSIESEPSINAYKRPNANCHYLKKKLFFGTLSARCRVLSSSATATSSALFCSSSPSPSTSCAEEMVCSCHGRQLHATLVDPLHACADPNDVITPCS